MSRIPLVLIVSQDSACVTGIERALTTAKQRTAVQQVERIRTALARIAGGGIDAVLIDLSSTNSIDSEKLESFLKLHAGAAPVPVLVLCEGEDDPFTIDVAQAGAFACIPKQRWGTELSQVIGSALKESCSKASWIDEDRGNKARPRQGKIIALLGAKGGVGTTSVSLNVGSSLARGSRVVIAELRPPFGTLSQYLRPQPWVRNLGHLLEISAETISRTDVEACLWPVRNIPGLSVLFAPQTSGPSEIGPEHAKTVLKHLAALADFILLDLPASLSETNRVLFRESDLLSLIVERDALCVEAAKRMLEAIEACRASPQAIGAVVVNRVPLALPLPLRDIESQLGIPTLAVIPPAADLCAGAQRARIPVISLDPESLVAGSLINFANELSGRVSSIVAFQPTLR